MVGVNSVAHRALRRIDARASRVVCGVRVALSMLVALVALTACDKPRTFPTEERVRGTAKVGAITLEAVSLRWGVHVGRGNGPGRGGFLDPPKDTLYVSGFIRPRDAKGAAIKTPYDEYVRDWLLFEHHWESTRDPDAIGTWEAWWKDVRFDTCEAAGGVAISVLPPAGSKPRAWTWVTANGETMTAHKKIVAPDCAAVRAQL